MRVEKMARVEVLAGGHVDLYSERLFDGRQFLQDDAAAVTTARDATQMPQRVADDAWEVLPRRGTDSVAMFRHQMRFVSGQPSTSRRGKPPTPSRTKAMRVPRVSATLTVKSSGPSSCGLAATLPVVIA
jgi:hypothetical protein